MLGGLKEILSFTQYHSVMFGLGLIIVGLIIFAKSQSKYIDYKINKLYDEEIRKYYANNGGPESDNNTFSGDYGTDPFEDKEEHNSRT